MHHAAFSFILLFSGSLNFDASFLLSSLIVTFRWCAKPGKVEIIHLNYWVLRTSHSETCKDLACFKIPYAFHPKEKQSKIRFWNVEIWCRFHHSRKKSYRYGSWEPPPTIFADENYYPSPHSSLGWVYAASAPKRSLAVNFDEQNGCRSPQQRRKTSVSCFCFIPEKKHGCFRLQCRFLLSG